MCTIANVIKGVVGVAGVAISAARNYNEQKDTLNYRTSLALNNMKEAKENAYAQKQLGIEEARKQKIEGIKRAKELIAQNAAGGFLDNFSNSCNNSSKVAFSLHILFVKKDKISVFERSISFLK